jgi:hypothetical protein
MIMLLNRCSSILANVRNTMRNNYKDRRINEKSKVRQMCDTVRAPANQVLDLQ